MALTLNTAPIAVLNTGAIGAKEQITFNVTSDVSLDGTDMYVRPSMFSPLGESVPTAAISTSSYKIAYPGVAGTATMIPQSGIDFTRDIMLVQLRRNSGTDFDIIISFLYKADRNGFEQNTTEDNLDHFEKNSIAAANTFTNTTPSVYNTTKQFRAQLINATGTTINDSVVFDQPIQARWWCSDLLDCSAEGCYPGCLAESVSDFSIYLTRGGSGVVNLSSSFATDLNISINIPIGSITDFSVAVIRRDSVDNDTNYWTDLEMSYSVYSPAQSALSDSPFPITAFSSTSASFTNTSGTLYEASVALEPTFFEDGAEYRFFAVITHSTGERYSCHSPAYDVGDPPASTFGTITIEGYDYSSGNSVYTAGCITDLACGERIAIDIAMDKDEYNDNIFTNDTVGDYDTNFLGIGVAILDMMPVPSDKLDLSIDPLVAFTLAADNSGGRALLTIPDAWVGLEKFLVFTYGFSYATSNPYKDFLSIPVKLDIATLSTDLTFVLTDDAGAPIGNKICTTEDENLRLTVTNAQGADYDLITLIRQGSSGPWTEANFYANNELSQESTELIPSADADFTGGDAEIRIDPTKLSSDVEYCIKAIAKKQTAGAPPPPDPCPAFTASVDIFHESSTTWQNKYVITVDLSGQGLTVGSISLAIDDGGASGTSWSYNNIIYGNDTADFDVIYPTNEGVNVFNITLSIAVRPRCFYSEQFSILPPDTTGTTKSTTVNYS